LPVGGISFPLCLATLTPGLWLPTFSCAPSPQGRVHDRLMDKYTNVCFGLIVFFLSLIGDYIMFTLFSPVKIIHTNRQIVVFSPDSSSTLVALSSLQMRPNIRLIYYVVCAAGCKQIPW
jgi:hypothetical protein